MYIDYKKYGLDEVLIVSRSGKIGSIYEIGRGIPVPLFGGQTTTLSEWNANEIVARLTVFSLIERLNYTGYLLTDLLEFNKEELETIVKQINDCTEQNKQ